MKEIAIAGAGGLAREVKWLIERINQRQDTWKLIAFLDTNPKTDMLDGIPVYSEEAFLCKREKPIALACAIGSSRIRRSFLAKWFGNADIEFPNLIDPAAILSDTVKMGCGNIVCAGSILTVDITLGDGIYVNLDCTVGHDAIVQSFVTINPSVNISGNVYVGTATEIGTGANVIQGMKIGEESVIGAGAVVVSDIPPRCTAVGCPAKVIKRRD